MLKLLQGFTYKSRASVVTQMGEQLAQELAKQLVPQAVSNLVWNRKKIFLQTLAGAKSLKMTRNFVSEIRP